MRTENAPARPAVVLLEDEAILAMTLADWIEEAGCEVVEVRSTDELLTVLEERPDIRVVVADLDTRGPVKGIKLAHLIRERWPPVELILTSSAPRPPLAEDLPARGVYFGKPFDGTKIMTSIRSFVGML